MVVGVARGPLTICRSRVWLVASWWFKVAGVALAGQADGTDSLVRPVPSSSRQWFVRKGGSRQGAAHQAFQLCRRSLRQGIVGQRVEMVAFGPGRLGNPGTVIVAGGSMR